MPLTPLKMNLDYESVLFEGKSSDKINHALEHLYFYLDEGPFVTTTNYSDELLKEVERLSGKKPLLSKSRDFENIWGVAGNLVVERELNSKILSARMTQTIAPEEEVVIVESAKDLPDSVNLPLLCKLPHSMSGKGVKRILNPHELEGLSFPYVIEPLLDRLFDFSHFIYPSGEMIAYENMVDQNFQYRGSIFHDMKRPQVSSLPRFTTLSSDDVQRYESELKAYRLEYEKNIQSVTKSFGYSIDSFVYMSEEGPCIRTCSEFNFRRTMGWLCYELGKKLLPTSNWIALRLFFLKNGQKEFRDSFKDQENVLLLSPKESKIQAILIGAENGQQGMELLAHADGFDVHKLSDPKL